MRLIEKNQSISTSPLYSTLRVGWVLWWPCSLAWPSSFCAEIKLIWTTGPGEVNVTYAETKVQQWNISSMVNWVAKPQQELVLRIPPHAPPAGPGASPATLQEMPQYLGPGNNGERCLHSKAHAQFPVLGPPSYPLVSFQETPMAEDVPWI